MGDCQKLSEQIPFVKRDDVETGMILMWSGTIATIPAGFVLCDGNFGTPDLRDKFVIGATQDDAGVAKTNLTGSLTQSGGDPDHEHTFNAGNHQHQLLGDKFLATPGTTDILVADPTSPTGVSGLTAKNNDQPPYFALAYIMKT
ncbi:hypothetical protein LCGC14_1609200 [marine sediment metagenome]|uniref:Phage tail collar domain-containing protein n=1 Tax=marine sediment metagenome TaxID=412755 RepID=A0A0F9I8V3_9ZZZZ